MRGVSFRPVGVDPDLLQARLQSLTSPRVRDEISSVLESVATFLAYSRNLDLRGFNDPAAGDRAPKEVWDEHISSFVEFWAASEALERCASKLARHLSLAPVDNSTEAAAKEPRGATCDNDRDDETAYGNNTYDDETYIDGDASRSAPIAIEPGLGTAPDETHVSRPHGKFNDRVTPTEQDVLLRQRVSDALSAVCTVLTDDISQLQTHVNQLLDQDNAWALITALQDHAVRVGELVNGIVTTIFANLPSLPRERTDRDAELESALELRLQFSALARSIRPLLHTLPAMPKGEWHQPVKAAANVLQQFMWGPAFPWMRAKDKHQLVSHFKALNRLLTLWNPLRATPTEQALRELYSFAEGLNAISTRVPLLHHDAQRLACAVENMRIAMNEEGSEDGKQALARALAELAEVEGRDPILDKLLDQCLDPTVAAPKTQLLARAELVLQKVNATLSGNRDVDSNPSVTEFEGPTSTKLPTPSPTKPEAPPPPADRATKAPPPAAASLPKPDCAVGTTLRAPPPSTAKSLQTQANGAPPRSLKRAPTAAPPPTAAPTIAKPPPAAPSARTDDASELAKDFLPSTPPPPSRSS